MKTILRNSLAVIVGVVAGSCANMALVMAGPQLIPSPPGVNMGDAKSLSESVHLLQPKHYLFPFLAHALGTFAGAGVANLLAASRRNAFGYGIGAFFFAGGIAAASMIPAPGWFIALDLVVAYLPMACLANKLGQRLRPSQRAAAA